MSNAELVAGFIDQIWNNNLFEKMDDFLHPGFKDHSLPPMLPPGREGIKKWIVTTGNAFGHHTVIEDQVTEGDRSVLKISMHLKHIGIWRDISPTGMNLQIAGYRYFKLKDRKIIEHWALIDGQAIENQLRSVVHGCKIQE